MTKTEIKKLIRQLQNLIGEEPEPVTAKARKERAGWLSQLDAANLLGINAATLKSWISWEVVPGPTHRLNGKLRLYYTRAEVEKMRPVVEARKKLPHQSHRRRADGLYSMAEIAKCAGCQQITIQHHIKEGHFPAPTHPHQCYRGDARFYTRKEAERVLAWLAKNLKWNESIPMSLDQL